MIGVDTEHTRPVAFPVAAARDALATGTPVRAAGVELRLVDGALVAHVDGRRVTTARQAYWFAWSQRHPGTDVWEP